MSRSPLALSPAAIRRAKVDLAEADLELKIAGLYATLDRTDAVSGASAALIQSCVLVVEAQRVLTAARRLHRGGQ